MKNKLIFIIVGLFLIGGIVAGSFALRDAVIPAQQEKANPTSTLLQGNISFDCGGEKMSMEMRTPRIDLIDDDFLQAVPYACDKQVTNVVDWNGRRLREVGDFKSFDESEIKTKECEAQSLSYIDGVCKVEVIKEEPKDTGGLE